MKIIISLLIISLIFLACNASNSSKSRAIVDIDNIEENEGFLDIPMTIVKQSNQNGYLQNTVRALSKSDTLELMISLKEEIPPGFVNGVPKNLFVQDGIIFESTGTKSNNFLNLLAMKYGLNQSNLQIKNKQIFTCANLTQNPINYKTGSPKFKIFLEDEADNAELFVNFYFKNATISLSEKDPDYRSSLINLMKK